MFKYCLVNIFSNMVERLLEIFMDEFSIFGDAFPKYLDFLKLVLIQCKKRT